ncbi:hypothetical protein LIER_09116 [Lithospermum erythrorhizon]|uniref:Uncharacterized protein n=1 Tax=Lithospermum erythrorhizon TaxID=34254 RepID=A0AAV3PFK5_LITER
MVSDSHPHGGDDDHDVAAFHHTTSTPPVAPITSSSPVSAFDPNALNFTAPMFNFVPNPSNSPPRNFNFAPNPPESAPPSLNSTIPVTDFLNSDPLQLHHSDHPNYVLATRLLNPNNYYHLRRSV